MVCENLYAKHSIYYPDLPDYVIGLFVFDEHNYCLDYDTTLEWFDLLEVVPAKDLYRGQDFKKIITMPSTLNLDTQEGFVVRTTKGFYFKDFINHVVKWVRPNHVPDSEHWFHKKIIKNGCRD